MSNLTRKSMLRVVAGTAVAAPVIVAEASPHPAAFPLTHDCDLELLELRRAIDAYQAAVRYELSLPEDTPEWIAAERECDARQAVIASLVAAIHSREPRSIRDITLRAEALRQYFFDGPRVLVEQYEKPDSIYGTSGQDYALAKLYEAAAIVTGGDNG